MKQQIENIIKKNLPEKRDTCPLFGDFCLGTNCPHLRGYNFAIGQTDTSLIADEVLKVVVEKVREIKIKDGFSEISGSYNSACDKILLVLNK